MATNPAFAATPLRGVATISTANTNRDGTGTVGTVVTAGSSGGRIDEIRIKATGTTTAGMVRLYAIDSAGTTIKLLKEQTIAAVTPSATLASEDYTLTFTNLFLQASEKIGASTHNAESFNVHAFGGSF